MFIGLAFTNIFAPYFHVVDEGCFIFLQYLIVKCDMRHLVKQREPETIDAVISQSKANDWPVCCSKHGDPVQERAREGRKHNHRNTIF